MICFMYECNHKPNTHCCSFYRFPKNEYLIKKWTNICRRADRKPNTNSRVCSCHFIDGKKENGIFSFGGKLAESVQGKKTRKRVLTQDEKFANNVDLERSQNGATGTQGEECAKDVDLERSQNGTTGNQDEECNENVEVESNQIVATSIQDEKTKEYILTLENKVKILEMQVNILTKELKEAKEKVAVRIQKNESPKKELAVAIKNNSFFKQIADKPEHLNHYTGLKDLGAFLLIFNYLERFQLNYYYGWTVTKLSKEDQLLLFLMKLRHNFTQLDLSVRFGVCDKTVRNVFYTYLHAIHETLFQFIIKDKENLPSLGYLKNRAPECYADYPNCRFILDCTEIQVECPRDDMEAQRQTYSHYKHSQTFKALTAVTPDGILCFASDLYPGSISDRELFSRCGIIDLFQPGDLILADKGFSIYDLMPKGVTLNIPPFLYNPQFTVDESRFTTKLARTRVQVERVNQRIKIYQILSCISRNLRPFASKVFQVCSLLVHFQSPLIKISDESLDTSF